MMENVVSTESSSDEKRRRRADENALNDCTVPAGEKANVERVAVTAIMAVSLKAIVVIVAKRLSLSRDD